MLTKTIRASRTESDIVATTLGCVRNRFPTKADCGTIVSATSTADNGHVIAIMFQDRTYLSFDVDVKPRITISTELPDWKQVITGRSNDGDLCKANAKDPPQSYRQIVTLRLSGSIRISLRNMSNRAA
jgi:hypothetical protein